jgi:hypothetical protein
MTPSLLNPGSIQRRVRKCSGDASPVQAFCLPRIPALWLNRLRNARQRKRIMPDTPEEAI